MATLLTQKTITNAITTVSPTKAKFKKKLIQQNLRRKKKVVNSLKIDVKSKKGVVSEDVTYVL